jgi:recombination protein RecT
METPQINFDSPENQTPANGPGNAPEKPKQETKTPENKTTPVQPSNQNLVLKNLQAETMAKVEEYVNELKKDGGLRLPENYAVGNQLRLAWMNLLEVKDRNGKPALEICTKTSIANALLSMCVQGLSVYKKQGDFIIYGNQLTFNREYHGTIALAKRYGGVKDVVANVIYKDDVFKYTVDPMTGIKKIIEHTQDIENLDGDIRGAYAVLTFENKDPFVDIMSIREIKQSWMQGPMKGQSPAHKNFPGEMCKKTVISRACKLFVSGSDDAGLFDDNEENTPQPEPVKEKPMLDIPITHCEDITPKAKKEVKEVKFED